MVITGAWLKKNIELCEWWMFIDGKMLEFDWWMFPASHVWLPQGAYIYMYIYIHIVFICIYVYVYIYVYYVIVSCSYGHWPKFCGFAQEICPEVRRQQYTKWCFDVETAATYTSSIVSMMMLMLIPPWCALSGITNHDQFSSWGLRGQPQIQRSPGENKILERAGHGPPPRVLQGGRLKIFFHQFAIILARLTIGFAIVWEYQLQKWGPFGKLYRLLNKCKIGSWRQMNG
jgi:hypothetical protein